jgi:phosphatidylinositol alpha-1,6-mannosyltransferase
VSRPMTGSPGRTLVVTNDFPPRRGGIEVYVRQFCDELDPEDVVVHTASMPGDAEYDARLPFPVVRDPAGTLLPTPAAGRRIEATLRRHGCDRVVFGASAPLGLLAPRLRGAGARHVTVMTHGHEVWWSSVPVFRGLMRRIGDAADVITYVSDHCRARIEPALSPAAGGRMVKRTPTVDRSRFHPGCGGAEVRRRLGIADEAPVVVCVARFVRRKGQDTLVRIWPEVRSRFPDAVLLLVGDGPDRARIKRMVRRRGLGGSVVLTGSVPWEAVPAHLDAGDVFAMPVRSRFFGLQVEAFGIVYLEAAASGLAVVGPPCGGASEARAEGWPDAVHKMCRAPAVNSGGST